MAIRTAANRARIIAWSRVRDDVGLTNQVCTLKTAVPGQEFKKVGGQFDFCFRAPLTHPYKGCMEYNARVQ